MIIKSNHPEYKHDYFELVRFFCNEKFGENDQINIIINSNMVGETINTKISLSYLDDNVEFEFNDNYDSLDKDYIKTYSKISLYKVLCNYFKKSLPWGALTGIRPTKLAIDYILSTHKTPIAACNYLQKKFLVSEKKAKIVSEIVKQQDKHILNDKNVNIYVHIPFCPSRCAYCSFLACDIRAQKAIVPKYIEALLKEIRAIKKLIIDKALLVNTIYIGGGTPSSLAPNELEVILNELQFDVNEFTVECGRPDTITKEKLDVLKEYNVTRISINPQSFSDTVLRKIGRNHTTADFIKAYKLAVDYDFDINMDLIAGLPGETLKSFKYNIDACCEFAPSNVTVHTLAVKNGSKFADNYMAKQSPNLISKMLDFSFTKLSSCGYQPYYLYRQKNMLGNYENIGYSQKGKQCVFNIDSMEETGSILAIGAGGISKRIYSLENRIERTANVKDIKEYLERLDEMIDRKIELFK